VLDDLGEVACAGVATWIFDLSEVGQRVTGAFLQIFDLSEVIFIEKFGMAHVSFSRNRTRIFTDLISVGIVRVSAWVSQFFFSNLTFKSLNHPF
jgi:hypothetical protein